MEIHTNVLVGNKLPPPRCEALTRHLPSSLPFLPAREPPLSAPFLPLLLVSSSSGGVVSVMKATSFDRPPFSLICCQCAGEREEQKTTMFDYVITYSKLGLCKMTAFRF